MSSRMRQRFDGRQGFLKVNCPRRYSAWKLRVGRWAVSGKVRGCDLYTAVNQAMHAREVPVTMGPWAYRPADGTGMAGPKSRSTGLSIGFSTCSPSCFCRFGVLRSLARELNSVDT